MPQIWHVTPDAIPDNVINIMKKNGFKDLSEGVTDPEPTMSLYKNDFEAAGVINGSSIIIFIN